MVCNPLSVVSVVLTTRAGVFSVRLTISTYSFVATSVGLVTVPSIVIILVTKLPDPLRKTIVLGVSKLVAVVAELATLPAVEMVANFVSTIAAVGETSALTINELDMRPDALL